MLEYNYYQNYHLASTMERCQVLDLSRRRDSVETRKTPSPCNTTSSFGTDSPSTQRESPFSLPLHHTLIPQQNSSVSLLGRHPIKSPSLQAAPYSIAYPEFKRENTLPPQNVTSSYPCRQKNIMDLTNVAANPSLGSPKINQQEPEDRVAAAVESDTRLPEIHMQALPYNIQPGPVPILYPKILSNEGKLTRPFKAYPRDPLIIAANFAATDVLYDSPRVERYTEYRKRVLEQIRTANGGERTVTNPKMRRINSRISRQDLNRNDTQTFVSSESEDRCAESSDNDTASNSGKRSIKSDGDDALKKNNNSEAVPNENGSVKDAAYYERRRKNNAAAKKSRDRRRIKEDEIAIRAAYLERQNIELLCQLDALKAQLAALTKC